MISIILPAVLPDISTTCFSLSLFVHLCLQSCSHKETLSRLIIMRLFQIIIQLLIFPQQPCRIISENLVLIKDQRISVNTTVISEKRLQLSHLVVHSLDVGDVHVMGGRTDIFILLTREDVDTNQVDLHKIHRQTGWTTSFLTVVDPQTNSIYEIFSDQHVKQVLELLTIL